MRGFCMPSSCPLRPRRCCWATCSARCRPIAGLAARDFAPVLTADPPVEILLLGCGARPAPVPAALVEALRAAGVALDVMDTGAACRTYNVLAAEARRVGAALIAVD